ncbi:MAG: class I adenylate-forming enzyme family protein [Candidatus Kariarchaeaceae archaeon]|jgi:acyl-CoA synthetase (AMP-forming)/AMP-acid ligase II
MNTTYPPQILANTAKLNPLKKMITYGEQSYSYQDGLRIVKKLAYELHQLNVKGKVVVSMPNSPEFIFTVIALFEIGAIPIPCNPGYTSYEMKQIQEDSGATVLATREKANVCFRFINLDKVHTFIADELLRNSRTLPVDRKLNPSDEAVMFYTSGSTGKMKGVVHTFESLFVNPHALVDIMNITSVDTYYIAAPFFHLFGFSPGMVTAIIKGAEIIIADTIGSVGVIDIIQNKKVTVLLCNVTMIKQLIYISEKRTYDITSLRLILVSGSIAQQEVLTTATRKLCKNTLNLYGTTETGIIAQTLPGEDLLNLTTSVGKSLHGIEIRIVDDNKKELSSGCVGEIACKTYGIFSKYHNMPSMTSEVVDSQGWYYTGDMGKMDERGYLSIVGRKNEMILKSGFNVYPREVELVLLQHPKIKDAAVVGIPDPSYGEIIRAVIIKNKNEDLTDNEILDHCRQRLIDYKIPDQIIIVTEFPLTSTGKIRKNELKKNNIS